MRTKTFNRAPATSALLAVFVAVIAGACSSEQTDESSAAPSTSVAIATAGGDTGDATSSTPAPSEAGRNAAAVLRFTAGATEIDVTLADNPTTRDLIAKLPLTLRFEEFSGREKIAYLPQRLATEGSPGIKPDNDDLIYFVPWGNLGFYYNTDGIGQSDQVIHIGDYTASRQQLERLQNGDVTVELIEAAGR
jgi:hypothetical protein